MSRGEADAGDEVTVSWGGDEFKCKVVEVKAGAVKVHYVGRSAGYDEWVSTEGEDKPPLLGENEAGVENVTKEAKDGKESQDENSDQQEESSGDQLEIIFSKTEWVKLSSLY